MLKRLAFAVAFCVAAMAAAVEASAQSRAICYNCPPEWADWGSQLKAIQSTLGIQVPSDNKNSGQAIAALIAEKANPVADVTYLGGIAADPAKDAGVLTPYKPKGWDEDSGRPQGSGRLLVHHSLRHARPVRQQGGARRQAGAAELGRSAEARIQGPRRLSRSHLGGRRAARRDGGQPGARRQL